MTLRAWHLDGATVCGAICLESAERRRWVSGTVRALGETRCVGLPPSAWAPARWDECWLALVVRLVYVTIHVKPISPGGFAHVAYHQRNLP